jgi:hypothetical protein
MRVRVILAVLPIFASGCALAPVTIDTPVDLVGEISNPDFTGWYRDYCSSGGLTKQISSCMQIGGEIYKVTLRGGGSTHSLVIAFPAHALSHQYRARVHVHLVKAPDAFSNETGIAYLATEWSDA